MPEPDTPIVETPPPSGDPPLPPPTDEGPLRAMREQLARQGEELNQLRANATNPPPNNTQIGPTKEQLESHFWKDPVGVSSALAIRAAQESSAAAVLPHLDTLIAVARSEARGRNPKFFDKYAADIEAKVAQVHPQYRANINVWLNAANNVYGEHLEDIRKDMATEKVVLTSDGPALPSSRSAPAAKGPADTLTDDQKLWASRLGLTPEQYAHGLGILEKGEKAWGEVITFDSDEKRRADARSKAAK